MATDRERDVGRSPDGVPPRSTPLAYGAQGGEKARRPARLSLADFVRVHGCYLVPVLLRGALVARRVGTGVLGCHPDPIGKRLFTELRERYGSEIFETRISNPPFRFDRTYVVLNPDLIAEVLESEAARYDVAEINRAFIGRFAPGALIIREGDEHARERRHWMDPERLATGRPVAAHSQAGRLLDTLDAEIGRTLAAAERELAWRDFNTLAARIAVSVVLGDPSDNSRDEDTRLMRRLKRIAYAATRFFGRRSWCAGAYYRRLARRRAAAEGDWSLIGVRSTILPGDAEATFWMTTLGGALDTTLPRSLALILAQPAVLEAVIAEVGGADLSRPEDIDDKLVLLEGCVLETIRLWTDTPLINRRRRSDGMLGGYAIDAGTQVLIPAAFVHRDPRLFGANADAFDPHRWTGKRRPHGLQFGLGPRACAGRDIALFLLKASLARFLVGGNLELRKSPLALSGDVPDLWNHFRICVQRR